MDDKPLQSTLPAEVIHMISLDVLIPIALVAVCIVTATAVSYVAPRVQGDSNVSGVALAALILTVVATLPPLSQGQLLSRQSMLWENRGKLMPLARRNQALSGHPATQGEPTGRCASS